MINPLNFSLFYLLPRSMPPVQTLRASTFGLVPSQLSAAILDIIDTLTEAGYEAYIVGGGVRDLLLGLHPKDFDAVTNATPNQIRDVFGKRCRIIGRRFELAHVYSGRDMIEVATFRAPPRKPATTAAGMITRDNVWGTIQQDFSRRDFTINALYYQPRKGQILDFCRGMDDIESEQIKFLGEPLQRFEEDPVRMLRVLRFAAKLEFKIDPSIIKVMTPALAKLLLEVSPHRLYDESQKMFTGGYLAPLMHLMIEHQVWSVLFADAPPAMTPFIQRAADNTDIRIRSGKSINPAFFYAVLMWQPFLDRVHQLEAAGMPHTEAWTQAGVDVMRRQQKRTAIPRYAEVFIREIWELQPRLIEPRARQIPSLSIHPRFRAGFDFLYLREKSGDPVTMGMGQWWHDYQELDNDQREKTINQLNRQQLRAHRKKNNTRAADERVVVQMDAQPIQLLPVEDDKPRRRRRTRQRDERQESEQPSQGLDGIEMIATDGDRPDTSSIDVNLPSEPDARQSSDRGRAPRSQSRERGGRQSEDRPLPRRRRRPRDLSTVFMGPY
jgi:poly(A) polymerase